MGYTHYAYTKPELDAKKFEAFAEDVKKLLEKTDVPLAYEYDETDRPIQIDGELVRFNGHGANGHETFYFSRKTDVADYMENKKMAFSFCKTAQKPYDKYVVACLVLAKKHFGKDIEVSSDGDMEEWAEGISLAEKVLGEKSNFKLGKD